MKLFNSLYKYGLLAKLFHWVTFIVLIIQIPLGLYLVKLDFSEIRINLEELHIFIGIIVFYLTLLRLIWKFIDPKQSPKRSLFKGQVILSKMNYFLMYLSLFMITASGILKKLFMGEELNLIFFKLQFVKSNFELADVYYTLHIYSNYLLVMLFAIHIMAVIVHHTYFKEKILNKML
jgi:cytochrome b561